jgi:type II secretory pathway component PulF
MPQFAYVARSRSGERVEGQIEAPDRRGAMVQIERMGQVPVSVREGAAPPPPRAKTPAPGKSPGKPSGQGAGPAPARKPLFKLERRGGRRPRMKLRDVLLLTRELSDLLSSGMTLGKALHTLTHRKTNSAQDQIVAQLRDEIVQGSSLSEAAGKWPESFSPLYISMVKAGEASGQLAEVLERLCRHYERVQEAQEKVLMALIYPCIVLSMGLATMLFAMIFVVPRFTSIFAELGSTLPLPTLILIRISEWLTSPVYMSLAAALLLLAVVLIRRALKTPNGRLTFHRMQLRIPIVKHIITANAYSHFARTLGALLANGVPVLQALAIVEDTAGNLVIAREIRGARDRVTDGTTISGPLAAGQVFPPLLTDMLAVGEESGDMSGALTHIARRYESELDRHVKIFTTVLEPILILFMAVMVGFVAISMLLAVFDLTSGLKV